jgi:hypothetical protein
MLALAVIIRDQAQRRIGYCSCGNGKSHPRWSRPHGTKYRTQSKSLLESFFQDGRIILAILKVE